MSDEKIVSNFGGPVEPPAFQSAEELLAAIVAEVGGGTPGSNRRIDPYAYKYGQVLMRTAFVDDVPWDSLLYLLFARADPINLALLNCVFPSFLAETSEAWRQV